MTQRTLPTANHRGIRASSEDRSAALLRASLERRNAKLADTVGRQAKEIVKLTAALGRAQGSMEAAQGHMQGGKGEIAWLVVDKAIADAKLALTETKP